MQGLGRTQNLGPVAQVKNAATRKAVGKGEGGGRRTGQGEAVKLTVSSTLGSLATPPELRLDQTSQSAGDTPKGTSADVPATTSSRSFRQWLGEVLAAIDDSPRTAAHSDSDATATRAAADLSFGVEKLSYKNMWKVLKTVVKEIGDIREASSGQFFLGVSERLDKATTLMEFGSLIDYLSIGISVPSEDIPPDAAESVASQIVSDAAASLEVHASIVPELALHLLNPVQ